MKNCYALVWLALYFMNLCQIMRRLFSTLPFCSVAAFIRPMEVTLSQCLSPRAFQADSAALSDISGRRCQLARKRSSSNTHAPRACLPEKHAAMACFAQQQRYTSSLNSRGSSVLFSCCRCFRPKSSLRQTCTQNRLSELDSVDTWTD